MNKKGFTLVEVIAVIAILALIIILVAPNLGSSSMNAKQKSYDTKVKLIEDSAIMYVQDNYGEVLNSATTTDGENYTVTWTNISGVNKFLEEYISVEPGEVKIPDPRDGSKDLANGTIDITINRKTKQITAKYTEPA